MRSTPTKLLPVREELAEESFAERTREDFILDRPIGQKQSASYVYERRKGDEEKDYAPHVLQSCNRRQWTVPRARLVDIARESPSFVATHFVFPHKEDVHVLSQIADMCLADVIETIVMTEEHASAILTQVVQALYEITRSGIRYNNLKASRVFISKEGVVQLANFAPQLYPQYLAGSENSDCGDVSDLAYHIVSKKRRIQQESQTSQRQKLQMKSRGGEVSIDPGLSSKLLDFLEACDKRDMSLLINHKFLGVSGRCLIPLVYNAVRVADLP